MPVDPSIIAGLKQPSFMTPADALGIKNAMYRNQLGQIELQEAQRGVQTKNALANLFK